MGVEAQRLGQRPGGGEESVLSFHGTGNHKVDRSERNNARHNEDAVTQSTRTVVAPEGARTRAWGRKPYPPPLSLPRRVRALITEGTPARFLSAEKSNDEHERRDKQKQGCRTSQLGSFALECRVIDIEL